jgi:hypothetical protein
MEKAFRECGVAFSIWQKVDENGHASNQVDWTSMMGSGKKEST